MLIVPRRTSFTPDHARCGFPSLFDPHRGTADLSVVFDYDIPEATKIADAWRDWGWTIKVGGPAFNDKGNDFIAGKYLKQGITITHRGCVRNCPWCYVPKREGQKIRCLPIVAGNILQDNNIFACPVKHQQSVFDMLKTQKRISLRGGLDARLAKDWHIDAIRSLNLFDLWTAYDSEENKSTIDFIRKLRSGGIPQNKIRCYCLIGYEKDTLDYAENRCLEVLKAGGMPFAQLFDKCLKTTKWKNMARKWSRPAIYRNELKRR